jgi:hypothetical protein
MSKLALARVAIAAIAALAASHAAAVEPRVQATYVVDSRDPSVEPILAELKRHLEQRAPQVLQPGQKLAVALLAVRLAGERSGSLGQQGVRVYSDGAPARIELSFSLRDGAGAVLSQGARALRSPLNFVSENRGSDPLRFEKSLLDDWLKQEFGAKSWPAGSGLGPHPQEVVVGPGQ